MAKAEADGGVGRGDESCGQEEIRANSSQTIRQEMTEFRPPTRVLGGYEGARSREAQVLPNHAVVPERSR